MADTEDLVLSISADVRQMQRALQRITGDTAKTTAAIQQQFDRAGASTAASFDQTASRANRAFSVIEGGAGRVARSMNASRLQTANLGAQLNDIGVQLAGGQSPFLIALQQGTQINQVLGQSGVRGAVGALGGAFASLVNPVSLATIAIIALGGVAVQYFTSLISDGEKSEEVLKKEAQLIQQVTDKWGDALPALKAYADERQKLADEALKKEATDLAIADALAATREEVANLNVDIADIILTLQTFGASDSEIVTLQTAFANLQKAVKEGKGGAEEAERVHAILASLFTDTSVPAVSKLADQFSRLAGEISAATEQANKFKLEQQGNVLLGRDGEGNQTRSVLAPLDPLNSFDANRDQTNRANATKSQFQIEQEKAAKSRSNSATEAEREAKAVLDLIDALEFERSLIGLSDVEREKANALRRAGAAATDEQRVKITGLTEAIYNERKAAQELTAQYDALKDIGVGAVNSLTEALKDGRLEGQELLSILGDIVNQLLNMPGGLSGLASLLGGIGGGGTTAFAGGILSGARVGLFHSGGIAGSHSMSRTVHPGVFAGAPRYHSGGIAGVKPGEVPAILQRGEMVLPKGARPGGGSVTVDARTTINAPNSDRAGLARIEAMIAKRDAELPAKIVQTVRTANKTNVKFG